MKKIALVFFIITSVSLFSQVKWLTMGQAIEAQKSKPKKIFIDFYADWCGPCKIMDKETFQHPVIANFINENYYPVKFNIEGNEQFTIANRVFANPNYKAGKKRNTLHQYSEYMNIVSVPTSMFLDEKSNPITSMVGVFSAKELEPYLHFFASEEYKKIKTREQWDEYQKKFKSNLR